MIISHKHKFIFFKTRKTAGSSIQVSLAKFCGENDIITGQYRLGIDDHSQSTGLNMDKFITNHPHPDLIPTKRFLGPEIWNSYFKFAFVRNPFDIAVSRYHWNLKGKNDSQTSVEGFRKWVKEGKQTNEDWLHRYICDTEIDLDYVGYYENLKNDLEYVYKKLGFPKEDLPKLKSGFRDKTHYSEFYDEETKQLIADFFKHDLELFKYKFNKD